MRSRYLAWGLCTCMLISGSSDGHWGGTLEAWAQEVQEWAQGDTLQEDVADVQVFYEPLAPYGRWTTLSPYGSVWIPHDVPAGWRPYTEGRWVYTRYGWTWVAEQPWGWAPFHYGRWAFVASYGWVWIPGTVWGPAWVAWRHAPGWVGWAPLPPQVVFHAESGLQGYDTHEIEPAWFCFVEERRLIAPRVVTYIVPPRRNVNLIRVTHNVTHYTVLQNRIVNNSLSVERIEKVTARPVPRMRLRTVQTPESLRGPRVRDKEREVLLYRPRLQAGQPRPAGPDGQTSRPFPAQRPAAPVPGGIPGVAPLPSERGQRYRTPPVQGPGTLPEQPTQPRWSTGGPSERSPRQPGAASPGVEDLHRRERRIPTPAPQQLPPQPPASRQLPTRQLPPQRFPQELPTDTRPRPPAEQVRPPREAQPAPPPPRPESDRRQPVQQPAPPRGTPPWQQQRRAEPPRVVTPQRVPSVVPQQGAPPQSSPPPRFTSPPTAPPSAAPQRTAPQGRPQRQGPARATGEDSRDPRQPPPSMPGQQPPGPPQ